jgi:alcohol dehydrogenase
MATMEREVQREIRDSIPRTMKALAFVRAGVIELQERPVPEIGPGEALVRITTTTICGTDVHILKGEYPVKSGLIIGHEPVGVIAKLGAGRHGLRGRPARHRRRHHAVRPVLLLPLRSWLAVRRRQAGHKAPGHPKAMGGWRFGNTIDGCQAEYVRVPFAQANLTVVPDFLTDEQVLMCPDIMSTGFGGAESGNIRIGDTVAVFAQGPIGLCATAGAKLMGATRIIVVDAVPERLAVARKLGADDVVNFRETNPVDAIMELTGGRGVDVAIEALGLQSTFENALRVVRPGGTVSSLGVYSGQLTVPLDAFAAGLGDHTIVTTLCPGGKERMRRLVDVIASDRLDLSDLVTHRFALDDIVRPTTCSPISGTAC